METMNSRVRNEIKYFPQEDAMRQIEKGSPVLVTGGTGYLASWIIKPNF
jgi:hypothetical protein